MDWQSALLIVSRSSPSLLFVAVVFNLLSLILRAIRWWLFLRVVGADSLGLAIRGVVVGAGLNNILVANGGEAARALIVSRTSAIPGTSVMATLAIDRIFDFVCFALLFFLAPFAIRLPPPLAGVRPVAAIILVLSVAMLATVSRRPRRLSSKLIQKNWCEQCRLVLSRIRGIASTRLLIAAFICSVGCWTLQIATFAFTARAGGVTLPVAGSIAAMLLADLGLVLRATPGNVGFFQFAYVTAARPFGVSVDDAIAAALLIQLVQMVPVSALAIMLAPGLRWSRRDRSVQGVTTPVFLTHRVSGHIVANRGDPTPTHS